MTDTKSKAHPPESRPATTTAKAPKRPTPRTSPGPNFHHRTTNLSGRIAHDGELVMDERFVLLEEIGRGGFGAVFKCYDQTYGRHVAIKQLLPPRVQKGEEMVAKAQEALFVQELRLQTEMQIMARLEHPNIVNVHEYVNHSQTSSDKYSYIVMEYLEGTTLFDRMNAVGQLAIEESVQVAEQLLNALTFIHNQDFIHRDLKPENIFVLDADAYALSEAHIKLLDFGLAIYKEASQRLTQEGIIGGTVWYLSPEQCDGADADVQSDLYSVGVILFEILTGELPFRGSTHTERLVQKLKNELSNFHLLQNRPDIHQGLVGFVRQALSTDKDERFKDAESMLAALHALRDNMELVHNADDAVPIFVEVPTQQPTAPSRAGFPPLLTYTIATVVILLTIILAITFLPDDAPIPEWTPAEASTAATEGAEAASPEAPEPPEPSEADAPPINEVPPSSAETPPTSEPGATPVADDARESPRVANPKDEMDFSDEINDPPTTARRARRRRRVLNRPHSLSIPRMEMERKRRAAQRKK